MNIYGGNGKLSIRKDYPGFVEIQFTVWRPEDDLVNQIEDTEMTNDKIIIQDYIRIRNNKVEISERLSKNKSIIIDESEDNITISLIDFRFDFEIPSNIEIENEFAATITSFSEFDNKRFLKEELVKSDRDMAFEIFPNPSNGEFNIKLLRSSDEKLEVRLFREDGTFLRTLYNGVGSKNDEVLLSIDDNNINSGIYFIIIVQDGIIETKRIVIVKNE